MIKFIVELLFLLCPPNMRHIDLEGYPELFGLISWVAIGAISMTLMATFISQTWSEETTRAILSGLVIYGISAIYTNLSLK